MSVRRALVNCAVLCVQEGSVVYPFCNNCYSRIDVQLQNYKRCACSKCGYNCPKALVGYRYRLSLRVTRQMSIFGITVFGTCLDPFFGIHASGLQRLLEEEPVEAATRAVLLKQAIKDCFIGRHFIFGLKVNDMAHGPWFDGSSGMTGGTTTAPAQFIATQILLPSVGGGAGCSVLRYYRALLQGAQALGSPGSSEAFIPAAPLVLPFQSPGRAVSTTTTTPPHSPLLSHSLHRLMYHGSVLSPDSPWQRSLGVVTSSVEQDTQKDEGDKRDGRPPRHHPQPNEGPAVTQRTPAIALHSANERGFSIGHSFTCSPWSAYTAEAPLSPTSPSPLPSHDSPPENQSPDRCPQQVDARACDPLAWEDDMAYSESLEAFIIRQENPSENRTASTACCHGNRCRSAQHSNRRTLADVSNMCTPSRACDAMPESARHVKEVMDARGTPVCGGCSSLVSCEPMGCKRFSVEGPRLRAECPGLVCDRDFTDDVYNYSADLFSDPMTMVTLATQTLGPSVGTTAANRQMFATPKLDDIIYGSDPVPLDFTPPSQSTPLPRATFCTRSGSAAVHQTRAVSRPPGCLKPNRLPPHSPRIIKTTPPPPGRSRSHRFTASQLHCRTQRVLELDPVMSTKMPVRKNHTYNQNQNLKLASQRRWTENLDRANHDLTARQIWNLQHGIASGLTCFTDVSVSVMCVDDKVVTPPSIGEMSFPVRAPQREHAEGCIGQTSSWEISRAQSNAVEFKTWGRSAKDVRWDGNTHHFLYDETQDFDLSRDLFGDSFH